MIHILIKLVKLFNFILFFFFISSSLLAKESLILGVTTSTYDSGLMTYLKTYFEQNFDCSLRVISKGTGQIINSAKKGNIDILITHHKKSEDDFMESGFGFQRYNLMYNDYIIVGPKKDPAGINNIKILENVMIKLFNSNSVFISRGDKSGTNYKELELWHIAKLDINLLEDRYIKIGQGMGATLSLTNYMEGYTVTDRSTWLSYKKKENLKILAEGFDRMKNQYSIIIVNPKKFNNVNFKWGKIFVEWILSETGKKLINGFLKSNKQLFYFNGDDYTDS